MNCHGIELSLPLKSIKLPCATEIAQREPSVALAPLVLKSVFLDFGGKKRNPNTDK